MPEKPQNFNDSWTTTLLQFLDNVYSPLEKDRVQWAIIGSVATVLQGCEIIPNDIDILVAEPSGVHHISNLMLDFLAPFCEYPPGHEKWLSSKELPISADSPDASKFTWVFARWKINEFKVEVAHITPPNGYYEANNNWIWEAGAMIWPHVRKIPFHGYDVPVIPLEIQLETCLSRKFDARIDQIITIFKQKGYNEDLLEKALSKENLEQFKTLINSTGPK